MFELSLEALLLLDEFTRSGFECMPAPVDVRRLYLAPNQLRNFGHVERLRKDGQARSKDRRTRIFDQICAYPGSTVSNFLNQPNGLLQDCVNDEHAGSAVLALRLGFFVGRNPLHFAVGSLEGCTQ